MQALFRTYLKKQKLRCTKERMAILDEVLDSKEHFEAEDIYMSLKNKNSGVSQASVYRTLPLLLEAGIIRKTPCDHMDARYELVLGREHHDHLVCLECGKIIEFRNEMIEELQKRVAKSNDFRMTGHRLIISGYCSRCKDSD